MCKDLRSEDIRQAIAEVGTSEQPSSYSAYQQSVEAVLADKGFSIEEKQKALVAQVLGEVAPLGVTDVDDKIAAKTGVKPWYIALVFFVLVCAAGGVIEYFVQRGLDKVVDSPKAVTNIDGEKRILVAIDRKALWRDSLAQLVRDEPRFLLLKEGSRRKYDAKIYVRELETGHIAYRFLSGDDVELAAKTMEPGPESIIINALCHHFTVEGYVLFVQDDEFWCDLQGDKDVKVDDRLVILRKKGVVRHPVTKELVPLGEETIGKAKILEVGEKSSRAKILSLTGLGKPLIGDKVRVGLGFSTAPRPWKRRFVVSLDWENLTITSEPQSFVNETTSPARFYEFQDGRYSGFSQEATVIVDGVESQPGEVEELPNNMRRIRITYPVPVQPGQTIMRTLRGKSSWQPIKLADGNYRYSTGIGQNSFVVEHIVVVELPPGASYVKSSAEPSKRLRTSAGGRETVIFNIETTPQKHFRLNVDFAKSS